MRKRFHLCQPLLHIEDRTVLAPHGHFEGHHFPHLDIGRLMDFFKDKIVFPEMLKLLLLSFAWLGNSGMCVLVGGGRAVNRKHHPAERCDLRFGFQSARKIFQSARKNLKSHEAQPSVISNFSVRFEKISVRFESQISNHTSPQGYVCTKIHPPRSI